MKFAIVNGEKTEAKPKTNGICQCCGSDLIPKCGRIKVWHWAHKGNPLCDPWWESETEWHRKWKAHFPTDWQEVVRFDLITGEKHIADVENPFGLVIEFQHSSMDFDEMKSREAFYKEMIWVVDGKRNELDEANFNLGLSGPVQTDPLAYVVEWWSHGSFLKKWSESNKKVYIDFGKDVLWRLVVYDHTKRRGVFGPIPKTAFIEDCKSGQKISVSYLERNERDSD